MEVISTVVGKMVEQITERLFTSIGRQIGYFVHYKENINDLKVKVDNLGDLRGRVQGRVERARNNGEVIEDDVLKWLSKVNEMEEDVKKLLEDENRRCFRGWCPDVRSCYRLGKEGKKKIKAVIELKEGGEFDTVAHHVPPPDIWFKSITDYNDFESRVLVFKKIMEALRDDESCIIGIYGMGGVGKTRMAEEIGKQAKKENLFDEVAMACVSQSPNIRKIQGELADCLDVKLDSESEIGRAGKLSNRLKNEKKNLVIIDDIWEQINLKEIGIPFADSIKGCKIVLTSRSQGVFLQMGVQKCFQIGFLIEDEAWALFKKKVGNSIDSPEMQSVAEGVCKECAGLPLAILAVGGVLMKYKNKNTWEGALEQLRHSRLSNIDGMEATLSSRIELSYNFLESADVKFCFLLCCLFQEDAEISTDDLVRYGVGMRLLRNMDTMEKARNRVHMLVDTLKTSSLLLEGGNENLVKMHDVIRDVAISIASKEEHGFLVKTGVKQWPEKDEYERCKVLSLRCENIHELPEELECPAELHTLVLECNNSSLEVPNGFFNGMKKLHVLHLSNIRILSLPKLVNLRMLCLKNCKLVDMASLKELSTLEILSLDDSNIKELAPEIRQLTHLRVLDLRECDNLRIIPSHVISSLSRLEELCISDSFEEWEVEASKKPIRNANLDELNSLISLIRLEIHIPNVMLLPKDLRFESLNRFQISIGGRLNRYSSSTRILKLAGVPLKDEFKTLMERTEVLFLDKLEGLKKVLHDRDGEEFSELKHLYIDNCNDMDHLLSKSKFQGRCSGSFSKLKVLNVEECRLKYLFSAATARGLPQLQELEIGNCEPMENVVGDDEEIMENIIFHQLKEMRLRSLPNLRSFYGNIKMMSTTEGSPSNLGQALFNEKVAFPALEELSISGLDSIREIWDSQLLPVPEAEGSFCGLRDLYLSGCDKLVNVFSSSVARNLVQLQNITISGCSKMEGIVAVETEKAREEEVDDEILVFPQLKDMTLFELPNLKSFCFSCGSEEEETVKEYIPQAQPLFTHKVEFPCLEDLEIKGLDKVKEIWCSTLPNNSVCKLRKLVVQRCGKLSSVAPSKLLGNFENLQELNVEDCGSLEEVFEVEGPNAGEGREVKSNMLFCRLKSVALKDLPQLMSFYSGTYISELPFLVEMRISSCPKLEVFSNEKVSFPILEELELSDGCIFKYIWDGHIPTGSFRKVRVLRMNNCNELVNATTWLQRFEVVKQLTMISCSSLEVVFDLNATDRQAASASQIKELELQSLPKLTHIWIWDPHGVSVFSNLTSLRVVSCNSLRYLFSISIARGLMQLGILKIESCDVMEEIVRNEEQGEEGGVNEIVFPQLNCLRLSDLPSLSSFCRANYAFDFPSLRTVSLYRCPELQNFTSGYTSTPRVQMYSDGSGLLTTDLNKYVEQHIWKGKGSVVDDDAEE